MGIYTEIRTTDLPVEERFAYWYESCSSSIVALDVHSEHKNDFQATARFVPLGTVQASALSHPPLWMRRSSRLIRQSDPEQWMLWLHQRGTFELDFARRQAVIPRPQEIIFHDSSVPFTGSAPAGSRMLSGLLLQVPRTLLPLRPSDVARLSTVTLDLLTTFLHSLDGDADTAVPPEAHQRVMQMRIHDFIHQRLDDPALTPTMIAAAHHISTRHLHKLFANQGLTVAGWIRQRRLERCRRDLADPGQRSRPVHAIANRWGFTDTAHFSRLFSSAYGLPPSARREYRHEDARGQVPAVNPSPTTPKLRPTRKTPHGPVSVR